MSRHTCLGEIVPGFDTLNRVDRSACSTTVRDLAITSHAVALTIDPETIVTPGIFVHQVVLIERVATQAGGFKKAA